MENRKYVPVEATTFEVEDPQNMPIEEVLQDEGYIDMSLRDRNNLEWKLGKEQRTMEGPNHLHGVYWKGHYWHYGVPQRKKL